MAQVSEAEILRVWNVLSGNSSCPGWRAIDLAQMSGSCQIKAARRSPGNEEAILVGFAATKIPPTIQLPQGQGFRMEHVVLGELGGAHQWLAIVRQPAGNLELFAQVASDIVHMLRACSALPEDKLYQQFLGRVRGWQEFMRQGTEGLSSEKELGLVGEISFLNLLLDAGIPQYTVAEGWKGPHKGLHDFQLGLGSVEIKSTMASEGFPVRIGSLDQLDDTNCPPLFLAGFRFTSHENGATLGRLVDATRMRIDADPVALRLFDLALHQAGYLDMHAANYIRQFALSEKIFHLVDGFFPRLAPSTVSPAIRRAAYELDLSLVGASNFSLNDVLEQLGVV